MGKIRIRTGRGTGTIEVDEDAAKWTGEQYRKIQEARKKAAGDTYVSSGRGTGRRKLADTPEPKKRPEYKGTRVSGRGTGTRKKSD